MEVSDIVGHLRRVAKNEGYACEDEALNVIARKADGGMRDALSIFDQVASFTGGNITYQKVIEDLNVLDYDYYFKLTDQLLKVDVPGVMLTLNEILSKGFEANHFMGGLASHFRDLLVSRDASTLPLLEVAESVRQKYSEQAQRCKVPFLYRALKLCNDCDINYRTSRNKRLLVEITLIEVAQAVDGDDASGGRGPIKKLNPLFSAAAPKKETVAQTPVTPAPKVVAQVSTKAPASSVSATPHTAAPAPVPVSAYGKKPVSLSIHTKHVQQPQPAVAATKPTESSTTLSVGVSDFEEKDLNYQWYRYAMALPQEETAFAGRMKNMRPILGPGYHIEVPVENKLVMDDMNRRRADILRHLQIELRNRQITLDFRLLEMKEEQHRAYSPRERYAAMLKKSESLCKLRESLGLELA